MAYDVKAELVTAVRIGEEWTAVEEGSFTIDSLVWRQGDGEVGDRQMGFHALLTGGGEVAAPLSSLTAVRWATAE